jgi:hypothetical protein
MHMRIRVLTVVVAIAAGAAPALAQTPQPESKFFVNVSGSGQLETRSFTNSNTFTSFGETGRATANQNVGRGLVVDVTGGYRIRKQLSVGVGVWFSNPESAAAGTVIMPDPVVFGRPRTVSLNSSDAQKSLNQRDVAVNIQAMWTTAIGKVTDLTVFGGPTVMHVKQDVATLGVAAAAQSATMSSESQSATTGKAFNVGADVTYWVTPRVGGGIFVRYSGGEVNLPAAPKLKVGGGQVGAGLRVKL